MNEFIPVARPIIGEPEREAVDRVMRSGMLTQGPEVEAFEAEFSEHVDGRFCVAVNAGTSALHLGLIASGVKPGDEVIVPSFTFAATANAIALAGATPVFVDIEAGTYCIDPVLVEEAITPRTVGVMPVHLFGQPADMNRLQAIAARAKIQIFEDACQAHDAAIRHVPVGTFGRFAAFSFYPTKNMTAGEGGMIAVGEPDLARTLRLLRNQGMDTRYKNEIVGFNNRMTDIHAAIGRAQFQQLPEWTTRRRANADFLTEHLRGVVTPQVALGSRHVYHQYTIRVVDHDRDTFADELAVRGIGSAVFYPTPVHELASFGLILDLPETRLAAQQVLSLPVHPSLTQDDLDRIVDGVNKVAGAGA